MNVTYNVCGIMCDISLKAEFPIFLSNKIKKGGKVQKKKLFVKIAKILDIKKKQKNIPFFHKFLGNGNGSKKKSIIGTAFMLHKFVSNNQYNRINN